MEYFRIYQSPRYLGESTAPEYICDQIGWGGFRNDYIDSVRDYAFFT